MCCNRRGKPHHDNEVTGKEPATSPVAACGSVHGRLPAPQVYAGPNEKRPGSAPFAESPLRPFMCTARGSEFSSPGGKHLSTAKDFSLPGILPSRA